MALRTGTTSSVQLNVAALRGNPSCSSIRLAISMIMISFCLVRETIFIFPFDCCAGDRRDELFITHFKCLRRPLRYRAAQSTWRSIFLYRATHHQKNRAAAHIDRCCHEQRATTNFISPVIVAIVSSLSNLRSVSSAGSAALSWASSRMRLAICKVLLFECSKNSIGKRPPV